MMALQHSYWATLVILLPMAGALACFLWQRRCVQWGLLFSVLGALSVAGLARQLFERGIHRQAIGGWGAPLGIDLYVDGLAVLMLAMTALVGLAVSVYAGGYFDRRKARHFWPLWLFLWSALNALFLSADIFNLYVTLELLGLAAVALIALAGGADALTGAMRYLLVSLLGSTAYLMGVALLYHSAGSVDIAILAQGVEAPPQGWTVVWTAQGLMSVGLLLKTALFPLHFWLPPAHASAPAPVSAVLSALVVKASFYILLRLWLEIFSVSGAGMGPLLGLLGAGAVLWGGVQALRQTRLKMLIAYSTVAQLGYLFLAFALGSAVALQGALYLMVSHALAKAAMFMAAGNILRFSGHDRIPELNNLAQRLPLTVAALGLAGVSLMGLPPSGGFNGKWLLLQEAVHNGRWDIAGILLVGGLLAAAYIFRVLGYTFTQEPLGYEPRAVPARMQWAALLLALGAILLGFLAPQFLSLVAVL
jgi:formate hydrogenlyase subunit 3/multisubunit Na+/H+ antiporter MnhD subunit